MTVTSQIPQNVRHPRHLQPVRRRLDIHHGRAPAIQAQRASVLNTAYAQHPERFVRQPPAPPKLPGTSWINPSEKKEADPQ